MELYKLKCIGVVVSLFGCTSVLWVRFVDLPLDSNMFSIRAIVLMFSIILGLACAAPGGWHHKHVKIIVPSHHHTVHHHHVEKVHVPVHIPVIKKVIVPVETHHDIHHHDIHHHDIHHDLDHHDDWHGGWW